MKKHEKHHPQKPTTKTNHKPPKHPPNPNQSLYNSNLGINTSWLSPSRQRGSGKEASQIRRTHHANGQRPTTCLGKAVLSYLEES